MATKNAARRCAQNQPFASLASRPLHRRAWHYAHSSSTRLSCNVLPPQSEAGPCGCCFAFVRAGRTDEEVSAGLFNARLRCNRLRRRQTALCRPQVARRYGIDDQKSGLSACGIGWRFWLKVSPLFSAHSPLTARSPCTTTLHGDRPVISIGIFNARYRS
jgi:hypothetical protein